MSCLGPRPLAAAAGKTSQKSLGQQNMPHKSQLQKQPGNLCALLGEGQGRHLLREWAEGEEGGEDAGESA